MDNDFLNAGMEKIEHSGREVFDGGVLQPPHPTSKPDEIFRRIERYCAGPYLELFARTRRVNWDAWGDQVNMFAGPEDQHACGIFQEGSHARPS
jgi:hypothetical protein